MTTDTEIRAQLEALHGDLCRLSPEAMAALVTFVRGQREAALHESKHPIPARPPWERRPDESLLDWCERSEPLCGPEGKRYRWCSNCGRVGDEDLDSVYHGTECFVDAAIRALKGA